jgi:hypothetical protein
VSETKELLRRGVGEFEPMPDAFDRVLARRDRKQRNQRVAAGVLGIVVFALAAIGLVQLLGSKSTPGSDPRSLFEGTWVSTSDTGITQTMTVRVSADGAVEITVRDDAATVCHGAPSTMTGTGRIEGGTGLVIPSPVYTCDDGSEPEALSGPPLEEQLRNLTFVLDAEIETLRDNFGGVWQREGAEDPSTTEDLLADLEPVWPQTSLEEVRQAQDWSWRGLGGRALTTRRSSPDSSGRSSAGRSSRGSPGSTSAGVPTAGWISSGAHRAGRTPCTRTTPRAAGVRRRSTGSGTRRCGSTWLSPAGRGPPGSGW